MPDSAVLRFLIWALVAIVAVPLAVLIYQRLRHGEWRLPWRRGKELAMIPPEEEEWRPEAAPVRSWLEEADALAAKGRFAEAIHHLLLRSVEDIARRRPRLGPRFVKAIFEADQRGLEMRINADRAFEVRSPRIGRSLVNHYCLA